MKYLKSGLTVGQSVMSIMGIIVFGLSLSLGFAWVMLWAWNLLASAAGWPVVIPINWPTVFAAMLVIWLLRSIFGRSKT